MKIRKYIKDPRIFPIQLQKGQATQQARLEFVVDDKMDTGAATSEQIAREIAATERAIQQAELQKAIRGHDTDQQHQQRPQQEPSRTRLQRLECEASDLELAQHVAEYVRQCESSSGSDDWHRLDALGDLLLLTRHGAGAGADDQRRQAPLYRKLYADEFLPLCDYIESEHVLTLRRTLQRSNYPQDCEGLLRQFEDEQLADSKYEKEDSADAAPRGAYHTIASCCDILGKVSRKRQEVSAFVQGSAISSGAAAAATGMDPALVELCRPLAERIQYHFLQKADGADDRLTSTRIDRLPEWLLNYLRHHVFQTGGAWELVYYGLSTSSSSSSSMAMDFLNEILRIVQVVLGERNFFRDPVIVGPNSKPLLLCQAVEQLLQFDAFVKTLIPANQANRILSLVDVCIAGDEELLQWWLVRERESVFSVLLDETSAAATEGEPNYNGISAKTELFGALIRSVRTKAAVFSFCGPYLSQVATPLCERFVDGVHASAVNLKRLLTQRQLPSDDSLTANVLCWIELINGTRAAAAVLMEDDKEEGNGKETTSQSAGVVAKRDMVSFGRSLERLQGVLIDEFVTNVVEVLLMERAKFAGYLMRCSHMLSSGKDEVESVLLLTDISPDLHETYRIFELILDVCAAQGGSTTMDDPSSGPVPKDSSRYAAFIMHESLCSLVAEKLLECALDIQGMTPDLLHPGCALFARDVQVLFGDRLLPSHALRVLDIAKFMGLESPTLGGIGGALCGLSGRPAPLTEAIFEADERLFDEAVSMIRAKGFLYLELADVFAVLNRRRDLM